MSAKKKVIKEPGTQRATKLLKEQYSLSKIKHSRAHSAGPAPVPYTTSGIQGLSCTLEAVRLQARSQRNRALMRGKPKLQSLTSLLNQPLFKLKFSSWLNK